MSRYTDLVGSKKKFIKEMLELDSDGGDFLNGAQYSIFSEILNDGRYKTEDSEWINKIIREKKEVIKKLREEKFSETELNIIKILKKHSNSGTITTDKFSQIATEVVKLIK